MRSTEPTPFEHLIVVPLSRAEWRVSDASGNNDLLGFIERQHGGRYEVVWMTDPMRWGYAATFDEALLAFGDSIRFTGEIFAERAPETTAESAAHGLTRPATLPRRSTWIKSGGRSSVA